MHCFNSFRRTARPLKTYTLMLMHCHIYAYVNPTSKYSHACTASGNDKIRREPNELHVMTVKSKTLTNGSPSSENPNSL